MARRAASARRSPFARRLVGGAVAGALGTLAMDLVWYQRGRRDGNTQPFLAWETAAGLASWDDAPAPGKVGHWAATALGADPDDRWARPATNVVHWATGIVWGVQYGVVAGALRRRPWYSALIFAPVVWGSGYVLLPAIDVYKPITAYDARTLAKDLSAHMVYGGVTTAVYAALVRRRA